jgi:hypothetical protein
MKSSRGKGQAIKSLIRDDAWSNFTRKKTKENEISGKTIR